MEIQKKLKLLGIASVAFGAAAALLCLTRGGIIFALPLGFIGMVTSGMYVFIDTRDEINTSKITPGIIGMLLSSIPVLLIVSVTIINSLKH